MTNWLDEVFGVKKPVIGMCHLPPLPGDPHYDGATGMKAVVEHAEREIAGLQEGGADGILISNEFSLPYLTRTEPITSMAMARVIGEVRSKITIPFGVNVLWDPMASIELAASVDASFVREIFTGVYASDFGTWDTNVGQTARRRAAIGANHIRLLYNIVPEAAVYLAPRELASIARSTVFNCRPDGLCVSGLTAGAPTDTSALATVQEVVGDTPVFVNTGVRASNVKEQLSIADAAIVGTYFKTDGKFENNIDATRVAELMAEVRDLRSELS